MELLPELRTWIAQLRGGFKPDESLVTRMRAVGTDRILPGLRDLLTDTDPELRCQAFLAIFDPDPINGVEALLP